jgi:hypothetical protein
MAITINGSGSITGLAVGGLPDGTVDSGTLATDSVVTGKIADGTILPADMANGGNKVVQIVNYQTGAVNTGTTAIPLDDSIPQITEGNQFMTLAITPKSATNKLKIDVVATFANSTTENYATAALFQDTTANALASFTVGKNGVADRQFTPVFSHTMTSGTTSATTFKVRLGAAAGTNTFNGRLGARLGGGVMASSITITEYEA